MATSKPIESGDFFQSEPQNPALRWMGCLSVVAVGFLMVAYLPIEPTQPSVAVKPETTKTVAAQPAR